MDVPTFPLFNWAALPEDERAAGRHVQTQLLALKLLERYFESAVELFLYGLKEDKGDWTAMAAESAILTIYNFRSTINSIRNGVGQSPTLKRKVNTKQIQSVLDDFDAKFPDHLPLRHGVCHYSDKMFGPPTLAEQTLDSMNFVHGMANRKGISFIVGGRRVTQPINQSELGKLTRMRFAVYEAFQKASQLRPEG